MTITVREFQDSTLGTQVRLTQCEAEGRLHYAVTNDTGLVRNSMVAPNHFDRR
jgi:hypothetical protein